MGDDALRQSMCERAAEVLDRFPMSRTMETWDELFSKILSK